MRKKCKLQCVLKCHCCCHRQSSCYSFAILLPVSPRNPKVWLCLICWQLKLSRRLKVARLPLLVDWNPPYLTLPPDLSISTSPNSYPSQWWHSILSDIYVLLYENGSCCWNQPLLSPTASQKRNHPLSLLQILQYFSFCSLDYFTRWKSIEIKDSLLEVGESFVSPKVMRCLPRCDHDSCCFFAHKAVPGQGTKLSINFEPFLVLDQRTT